MGALSDSWRMSADPPQLANGWDAAINNIGGRLPQLSDGAAPQAAPLDDPLSAYPAAARERVVELRQRADDLFAAVDAAASKREEARQALQYAEAAMRRLRGAHS